ncbi:DMT family transporter [Paenibacillus thalictri]|uniref:Multidrug efflux SMR transporter n=1 Tax=Paenibacillus thalictri TaxID=2527873 RepID=A0A4Q9DQ91_9BACL|nr:multidrug efflux SMR transporter [Paenibacillus thalictri]TBL78578.1 multidrug efflux SMR transporter [Paenibacillus thalictri]
MAWICLFFAGTFEIVGATALYKLKMNKGWKTYGMLAVSFIMSFTLLSLAMRSISMGTAYAVWTGIGTVGSAVVGMFVYGESKSRRRIFYISLVLAAAVGLKLIA